jgi:SagB-type dehydrogenase family enzyme
MKSRRISRVRLRRARTLQVYWTGADPTFENFLTHSIVSASPVAFRILCFFNDWRHAEDVAAELPEFSPHSVQTAVRQLVANKFLLEENSPAVKQDEKLAKEWAHWLPHGSFHFSTRNITYITPEAGRLAAKGFLRHSAQPSFYKSISGAKRIPLTRPSQPEGEFLRALLGRRTHREFSPQPITRDKISTLLYYTFGVTGYLKAPVYGMLPLTTSPSGGARHPIEAYMVALRVKGLPRGIYHYNTRNHELELVRNGATRARVLKYAEGQTHVGNAAAVLLMTAVFPRTMWKYRSARAYRVVLLDSGHVCQTFCLVASWLGLAPFCTAVFSEKRIEEDLRVDGISESAMYVAGVGMPVESAEASAAQRPLLADKRLKRSVASL